MTEPKESKRDPSSIRGKVGGRFKEKSNHSDNEREQSTHDQAKPVQRLDSVGSICRPEGSSTGRTERRTREMDKLQPGRESLHHQDSPHSQDDRQPKKAEASKAQKSRTHNKIHGKTHGSLAERTAGGKLEKKSLAELLIANPKKKQKRKHRSSSQTHADLLDQ